MLDLNTPRLTKHQKEHFIRKQINPEYSKRYEKGDISFDSYWLVKMKDLCRLNDHTISRPDNDYYFWDFYPEKLSSNYPDWDVILFQSDRFEKGEWDNFYGRYEKNGYQLLYVIGVNGHVAHFDNDGLKCHLKKEEEGLDNYPESIRKVNSGSPIHEFGLLECPLDVLEEYESNRVYGDNYVFGENFSHCLTEKYVEVGLIKPKKKKQITKKRGFAND